LAFFVRFIFDETLLLIVEGFQTGEEGDRISKVSGKLGKSEED